jgi:hypothetical protein
MTTVPSPDRPVTLHSCRSASASPKYPLFLQATAPRAMWAGAARGATRLRPADQVAGGPASGGSRRRRSRPRLIECPHFRRIFFGCWARVRISFTAARIASEERGERGGGHRKCGGLWVAEPAGVSSESFPESTPGTCRSRSGPSIPYTSALQPSASQPWWTGGVRFALPKLVSLSARDVHGQLLLA